MAEIATLEESLLAYKCQNPDCRFYFTQKVDWGNYYCPVCKYPTKPLFNYYHLFGLEEQLEQLEQFDIGVLKDQYRRLSLRYHPDKSKSELSEEFIAVRKGYEILSDDTEKEIYDHELSIFNHFLEGKVAPHEVENERGLDRGGVTGWVILFLVGVIGGGAMYFYTRNYYYSGFATLIWFAASMIWRQSLLKGLAYLVEILMTVAIGYTLFQQKWVETLILILGLTTYFLIKRKNQS